MGDGEQKKGPCRWAGKGHSSNCSVIVLPCNTFLSWVGFVLTCPENSYFVEELNFCHYIVWHSPALSSYRLLSVCYKGNIDTEVLDALAFGKQPGRLVWGRIISGHRCTQKIAWTGVLPLFTRMYVVTWFEFLLFQVLAFKTWLGAVKISCLKFVLHRESLIWAPPLASFFSQFSLKDLEALHKH